MATAAKAKLLLRELKTVKADLAFAKARCAQLEEENKLLRDREGRETGHDGADDDLVWFYLFFTLSREMLMLSFCLCILNFLATCNCRNLVLSI